MSELGAEKDSRNKQADGAEEQATDSASLNAVLNLLDNVKQDNSDTKQGDSSAKLPALDLLSKPTDEQMGAALDSLKLSPQAREIAFEFHKVLKGDFESHNSGFIEIIRNYADKPEFKEGVDAANKAFESLGKYYDLRITEYGDLSFARNEYFFVNMIKWQKHREEVVAQEDAWKKNNTDPFGLADKKEVADILKDWQTFAKQLGSSFEKWDKNGDKLLVPSELANVFTSKDLSAEERALASAVRSAYDVLRTMDFPKSQSDPEFLDEKDILALQSLYDPEKREFITHQMYRDYERKFSDGRQKWWEFQPIELAQLWWKREFTFPGKFDEMAENRISQLTNLGRNYGR